VLFQASQGTSRAWQLATKVTVKVSCRTKLLILMTLVLTHTLRHLLVHSFHPVQPLLSNVHQSWGIVGWNSVERSHEPILPRIQHLYIRYGYFTGIQKECFSVVIHCPFLLKSLFIEVFMSSFEQSYLFLNSPYHSPLLSILGWWHLVVVGWFADVLENEAVSSFKTE